ncbi:leucine-rich repeat-containing protein 15 [Cydia splendana]|uniref:leucine-rich repeat-containing protein 15 n=1 Tax=Cydia splendana TaxID=1100963 RepID=UPI00300DB1A4
MGTRLRELLLLLVACTLALSESANKTAKTDKDDNFLYQYDDYETADDQKVLFSEDKPCPRDCICTATQGYKIAKCNRLEIGTQKFGDDITDIVIENADPRFPINLDDYIFKKLGLHQIATVKIVNSTIGTIGPNAFHGLQDLYAVNLSNNKLKSLHPETFANNKKLLLLTLSNNPLKFPAPNTQDYFLNASSVQELDVSYCNMQYITPHSFKNLPSVMYLNVAGNNLSEMDPDTFKKLLDLEELDLSDNNIQSLPNDIFSENTELATLHIQRNPIDTVYDLQVSDLLTLNAGQTNIKFVGPSMFNGMTYIANLNLSGNNIEKIHNQAFHKLIELNYLDLSYNNLDFISSILIKENIELDIFKISYNPRLKKLPEDGFNCSADQFNMYLFEASNCGLEEISDNALRTFTALSQINLSGNKIKSISNQVFSRCPKLVDINLANNMLTTLDIKIFEKNTELGRLNLQGNPIKTFSAEVFLHTPTLQWLDLSHAELTSLWRLEKNHPKTLLGNLSFLNVSHNRIAEIKLPEVENLKKLRTLDISNNPLACGREFENLMTWLSKQKVSSNGESTSIANLARDAKEEEATYSWEALTKKTCGSTIIHPVEPLPSVSDEEIWERIDKDDVGNFDLKDTLDDGKIADDGKDTYQTDDDKEIDDDDDMDGADDSDDDDEDEDDDDEEEDDSGEDEDSNDMDLSVKLKEKPALSKQAKSTVPTIREDSKVEIDVKLLDNDNVFGDPEPDFYPYIKEASMVKEGEHGHYLYLWPILIAILGAILLMLIIAKVVMVMCSRRDKQMRYNSAIIAAMSQQGRTKKDCGLVYQQLSEDLTGPATPKLNRYQPLHSVTVKASNMYESSPFHHNNIVPEAV